MKKDAVAEETIRRGVLFPVRWDEEGPDYFVPYDRRGWHTFEPDHCEICKRMHEADKRKAEATR